MVMSKKYQNKENKRGGDRVKEGEKEKKPGKGVK